MTMEQISGNESEILISHAEISPIKQYFHKQCAARHSAPSSGHAIQRSANKK